MLDVWEITEALKKYELDLEEVKGKVNPFLDEFYGYIYGQSYPKEYLDILWMNLLFEIGFVCAKIYDGIPEVFKEAFR